MPLRFIGQLSKFQHDSNHPRCQDRDVTCPCINFARNPARPGNNGKSKPPLKNNCLFVKVNGLVPLGRPWHDDCWHIGAAADAFSMHLVEQAQLKSLTHYFPLHAFWHYFCIQQLSLRMTLYRDHNGLLWLNKTSLEIADNMKLIVESK